MKTPVLYIETSIFGFYFDDRIENGFKVQAVKELLGQIKAGAFHAFVSPVVVDELSRAPHPYGEKLLKLIDTFNLQLCTAESKAVDKLFSKYMRAKIVPDDYEDDARHVAYATILKADSLVSYNLAHLANEWSNRRFNKISISSGYSAVPIRTPEEVVRYDY